MKSKFEITLPKYGFNLSLFLVIFLLFIIIQHNISNPETVPTEIYIGFGMLMLLPIYYMFLTKYFRISVSGNTIFVKRLLRTNFSFDVSDIKLVKWNIIDNSTLHIERILIITNSGKKLSVDTIMLGFGDMAKYIKENIPPDRIKINLKKGK